MLIFIPPPRHYGSHRPAPVASSAAPVPAALSASASQWPALLAIRLPSPTARSPGAAAPSCAGTTITLALGVSAMQPFHPRHQVGFGRLEQQVMMVRFTVGVLIKNRAG